jgi:hypothetical protein
VQEASGRLIFSAGRVPNAKSQSVAAMAFVQTPYRSARLPSMRWFPVAAGSHTTGRVEKVPSTTDDCRFRLALAGSPPLCGGVATAIAAGSADLQPNHEQLIPLLLQYDVIGVQTEGDVKNSSENQDRSREMLRFET